MKFRSFACNMSVASLIAVAAIAVYFSSRTAPFLFDSVRHIENNPRIRTFTPVSKFILESPRPVTDFTFALNYHFTGLQPGPFREVNILVHILSAVTLYFLLLLTLSSSTFSRTICDNRRRIAASIAMIWTVHPLNTQAVTYIVQRGESMMGLSLFLFLLFYALSTRNSQVWLPLTFAFITFCIGLGCKQVMVTALPLAVLYQRAFLSGSWRDAIKQRGWFWSVCAVPVVLAVMWSLPDMLNSDGGAGFGMKSMSPLEYLSTQPQILLHYLRLVVWPAPLVLDYGWPVETNTVVIALTTVVVGLALSWLVFLFRRMPGWSFWGLAAAVVLLPTSSILPLQDLAVEHRMYVPAAFLITLMVLLVVVACERFAGNHSGRWLTCLCGFVVVGSGILTIGRNADYASPIRMWTNVIANTVNAGRENRFAGRAYCNLGMAYGDENKWEESITWLKKALKEEVFPDKVHGNLARAYIAIGQIEQAKVHAARALMVEPDSARVVQLAGLISAAQKDFPRAEVYFRAAAKLAPGGTKIRMNLAQSLADQQRFDEAIETLEDVIRADRRFIPARRRMIQLQLWTGKLDDAVSSVRSYARSCGYDPYLSYYEGEILLRLNEVKEAISKWEQSLRASPPPRGVHFRLGNAYRDQGDAKKAKEHYQKAVSENPEHIEAINSLGGVVARTDPRKAMEYYENVIKLAPLFPIARFNVAALNVQLQNINLARRQLGELLQDSPDFEPATELLKSLDQHAVNNED